MSILLLYMRDEFTEFPFILGHKVAIDVRKPIIWIYIDMKFLWISEFLGPNFADIPVLNLFGTSDCKFSRIYRPYFTIKEHSVTPMSFDLGILPILIVNYITFKKWLNGAGLLVHGREQIAVKNGGIFQLCRAHLL